LLLLDKAMNDSSFIQGEMVQWYGCLVHFYIKWHIELVTYGDLIYF